MNSAIDQCNEIYRKWKEMRKELKTLKLDFIDEMSHPIHKELIDLVEEMFLLNDDVQREVLEQEDEKKILETFNRIEGSPIQFHLFNALTEKGILKNIS